MDIDIDNLTCDELLDLNDRILARLKQLDAADTIDAMTKLTMGSKVCFDSGKQGMQVGILIKFNQRTVTVLTEDRRRWKVSPQLLSPVIEDKGSKAKVIDIQKK